MAAAKANTSSPLTHVRMRLHSHGSRMQNVFTSSHQLFLRGCISKAETSTKYGVGPKRSTISVVWMTETFDGSAFLHSVSSPETSAPYTQRPPPLEAGHSGPDPHPLPNDSPGHPPPPRWLFSLHLVTNCRPSGDKWRGRASGGAV